MSNLINKTAKQISASKKEITFNLQKYINEIIVIKYGGNAMADNDLIESFCNDIVFLKQSGLKPVIVHGGGPQIGSMLERLGIKTKFESGMRITDESTLEVVEMVLAGKINKDIASKISTENNISKKIVYDYCLKKKNEI